MLLAAPELLELIELGVIDAEPDNVNAASIDIRIGDTILVEDTSVSRVVNIDAKESPEFIEVKIPDGGIVIPPNKFFLAHSIEKFNLPNNISAQLVLRSTLARCGMEHLNAGWADAGFNNAQLTFEFKNMTESHGLLIKKGMRVAQMKFYKHSPAGDNCYSLKGNYNGQQGAQDATKVK